MHMCSVLCVLSLGFVGCSAATTDCSNNAYAITCSVIIIELLYVMSRLFSFERSVMWLIYEQVSGAKTDVLPSRQGRWRRCRASQSATTVSTSACIESGPALGSKCGWALGFAVGAATGSVAGSASSTYTLALSNNVQQLFYNVSVQLAVLLDLLVF